ncbi:PTS sugar transporter subunit IIA [Desulfobulbus alkaliphilus]|uniref:PTS sugar transporter subunit IIA n=1 Tax=Desulfobulbus alkaliphilus TaxID=869814 RepID=UPI0019648D9C|nr:PTS sugar transporter subunit IIA [Desulfobulbus alkaliphilus]MBM9537706.1 PTS sugar transporter subunit IIA [Desulfobulbus alkaliphilus]
MNRLDEQAVILEMKAVGKESALREMAALAAKQSGRFSEEVLYNVLLERESVGSTGVGNGVAIPHGKIVGLEDILLCFGRSRAGLNFDAVDNRPVHLFVLLLSPADKAAEYLRALAWVSRILKKNENRRQLLNSKSRAEVAALFAAFAEEDK